MSVAGLGTCRAVFHSFFHIGKYSAHGLCAEAAVIVLKSNGCENLPIFRGETEFFLQFADQGIIACFRVVLGVGIHEVP